MTLDELQALPVGDWAAPDAHLYCWVTNKYIEKAYPLVRKWGFSPVVLLTWAKPPMGMGLGGAFVQTSEHILFARRGRDVRIGRSETTWWNWSRVHGRKSAIHSAKPPLFLDVVEQVSPGPYLELFSRATEPRVGWEYWGDESLGTASLTLATYAKGADSVH
jgi:N6-adenosine-specific RNA methylase IME4